MTSTNPEKLLAVHKISAEEWLQPNSDATSGRKPSASDGAKHLGPSRHVVSSSYHSSSTSTSSARDSALQKLRWRVLLYTGETRNRPETATGTERPSTTGHLPLSSSPSGQHRPPHLRLGKDGSSATASDSNNPLWSSAIRISPRGRPTGPPPSPTTVQSTEAPTIPQAPSVRSATKEEWTATPGSAVSVRREGGRTRGGKNSAAFASITTFAELRISPTRVAVGAKRHETHGDSHGSTGTAAELKKELHHSSGEDVAAHGEDDDDDPVPAPPPPPAVVTSYQRTNRVVTSHYPNLTTLPSRRPNSANSGSSCGSGGPRDLAYVKRLIRLVQFETGEKTPSLDSRVLHSMIPTASRAAAAGRDSAKPGSAGPCTVDEREIVQRATQPQANTKSRRPHSAGVSRPTPASTHIGNAAHPTHRTNPALEGENVAAPSFGIAAAAAASAHHNIPHANRLKASIVCPSTTGSLQLGLATEESGTAAGHAAAATTAVDAPSPKREHQAHPPRHDGTSPTRRATETASRMSPGPGDSATIPQPVSSRVARPTFTYQRYFDHPMTLQRWDQPSMHFFSVSADTVPVVGRH